MYIDMYFLVHGLLNILKTRLDRLGQLIDKLFGSCASDVGLGLIRGEANKHCLWDDLTHGSLAKILKFKPLSNTQICYMLL